jgi:hypothetical protein
VTNEQLIATAGSTATSCSVFINPDASKRGKHYYISIRVIGSVDGFHSDLK